MKPCRDAWEADIGKWEGGIKPWKTHGQSMFDNDRLVDNELKTIAWYSIESKATHETKSQCAIKKLQME